MPAMRDAAALAQDILCLVLPLHRGSYSHPCLQKPLSTAHTPMMDFPSWSQAAVLSPSQCPPQRPEEGNVERVMTIPLSPVTSCIALVGTQGGRLKKGWERGNRTSLPKSSAEGMVANIYCICGGSMEKWFGRVWLVIGMTMQGHLSMPFIIIYKNITKTKTKPTTSKSHQVMNTQVVTKP